MVTLHTIAMRKYDIGHYALNALRAYRTRTLLTLIAMSIGVAAVIVLTALGEGARLYVLDRFASLGTHLLIVLPGRTETSGGNPALLVGETPRDLTIEDAKALLRSRAVRRIAPINVGSVAVAWHGREREVTILGSTAELLNIRHWKLERGRFLPSGDITRTTPVCVIGKKLRKELFGAKPALGEWLRIGDRRFRVTGLIGSEGRSIGIDIGDTVIIPVASAQALFDSPSLFRILVETKSREAIQRAKKDVLAILRKRHQGEEDVTVITQDAVLATFDRIFKALTLAVAGIAAISLSVAGILIMNVMLVAITQRTTEIGLLKALGATGRQIMILFLVEATALSFIGAMMGLLFGQIGSALIRYTFPTIPAYATAWAIVAAIGVALLTGILFSILPARRASRLNPVQALVKR